MNDVIRIIARKVPWPSLAERPDRSGLKLRWDVLLEDGTLLAKASEWPLTQGAYELLQRGHAPEGRVTMRHEGAEFDSFAPVGIGIAAAPWVRRVADKERLKNLRSA